MRTILTHLTQRYADMIKMISFFYLKRLKRIYLTLFSVNDAKINRHWPFLFIISQNMIVKKNICVFDVDDDINCSRKTRKKWARQKIWLELTTNWAINTIQFHFHVFIKLFKRNSVFKESSNQNVIANDQLHHKFNRK